MIFKTKKRIISKCDQAIKSLNAAIGYAEGSNKAYLQGKKSAYNEMLDDLK